MANLTALEIARLYAVRGFRPIPLNGKAPRTRGWERYSWTPPTDTELRFMFDRHRGNTGTAVPENYVVIDVDMHNADGLASLSDYEHQHGDLPPTLSALTGSGGQHFWFKLPPGVQIKAGGALAEYPGVEFKGPRGQVVLPPSIHPDTGRPYVWEANGHPDDFKLADLPEIPPALLAAILADPITNASPTKPDGSKGRLTDDQVRAIFDGVYHEGERRSARGLPRIVGILRSRAVPVDDAADFVVGWQQGHFVPPLSVEEAERHVRDMYRRYGQPAAERESYGLRFIDWLNGKHVSITESQPASPEFPVEQSTAMERPSCSSGEENSTTTTTQSLREAVPADLVQDSLTEAAVLFPIDGTKGAQRGGQHSICRQKADHRKSQTYVGGYSTSWDPEYEQNIQDHRQEIWARTAPSIRTAFALGLNVLRGVIEWGPPVEVGTDPVKAVEDPLKAWASRQRKKGHTVEIGFYHCPGMLQTVAYMAQSPEVEARYGFTPFMDADEAIGDLHLTISDLGVGRYFNYPQRTKAWTHTKAWAADLPEVENRQNERIGALPDIEVQDIDRFVRNLEAEASIRNLRVEIATDEEVNRINPAKLLAKIKLHAIEAFYPEAMDGEGAWQILDCWRAVGALLTEEAYGQWLRGRAATWVA